LEVIYAFKKKILERVYLKIPEEDINNFINIIKLYGKIILYYNKKKQEKEEQ